MLDANAPNWTRSTRTGPLPLLGIHRHSPIRTAIDISMPWSRRCLEVPPGTKWDARTPHPPPGPPKTHFRSPIGIYQYARSIPSVQYPQPSQLQPTTPCCVAISYRKD